MRIVVVEDSLMVRDLVVKICRETGHRVIAETGSGIEAIALCRSLEPDLLMLDLGLPDIPGMAVAEKLRASTRSPKIVVLSAHREDYWLYRIERVSVQGFLDKDQHLIGAIADALTTVEAGKTWFSPSFRRRVEARRRDPHSFEKKLTDREIKVLTLVRRGLSSEEIAPLLNVAPRTIDDHCSNIRRKLGIATTAKLMAFAADKGF